MEREAMLRTTGANTDTAQPPRRLPPSLEALVAPEAGMSRQARVGGVLLPLGLAMLFALSAGLSAAVRVNAREATLQELETSGQLATMSDRAIDDAQKAAEQTFVVKRIALAIAAPPAWLLLLALGVLIVGWFAKGRTNQLKLSAVFPVAAAGLLPFAIADLLETGSTLQRATLSSAPAPLLTSTLTQMAEALGHPIVGAAGKILSAVDVFSLWSAVLVAFGVAAASNIPTRRALVFTLIGWFAFRLIRTVLLH